MIQLTGGNLGERQRELNRKVIEAAKGLVNFNEIKDSAEETDVDKLFKIDLASEFQNTDYIIKVLMSGDSLCISRALKCTWIYEDCFSYIINVHNLHDNVIPFMSTKMKKKLLTAISIHVRSESRAAEFYKYCMDIKLKAIALKFLNFTNEAFKLEVLKDKTHCNLLMVENGTAFLKHLIGPSFTLAEAYIKELNKSNRMEAFEGLTYLYTVSGVKYLDLLEKYVEVSSYNSVNLGIRISKNIMKEHKDRVLKMPSLYISILNKASVARYSTGEDAKIYLPAFLPDNAEYFWNKNFCSRYTFIIDKITDGKFQFVKQIFTAKYPEEDFETVAYFYHRQCYTLMTTEEQEKWALEQLANENEILGIGKEYLWYKFVSFDKAFEEIRKLVLITTDYTKRADMMFILNESATTQSNVLKLLNYYYDKHGNEQKFVKENFIDRVLGKFNVFKFDEECWTAFNKILHNLEVYSLTDFNSKCEYRIVALVYFVINKKEIPEAITNQLSCELPFYALESYKDKLTEEQKVMLFEYLFKFYTDEIKKLTSEPYLDEVKYRLRKFIHFTLDLLDRFDKTKEDIPELVMAYMKLDWAEFECHNLVRVRKEITKVDLFRDLKKDAKLLVERLPFVKMSLQSSYKFEMSTVLKKLKTYFPNDIAMEYLKFFESLLDENHLWHQVTQAAVHGIFQLGDDKYKVDMMTKYAPKESKINRSETEENLLRIQQAICAHACYSRPPVPLKTMFLYIKGDYVHFCIPMFHKYLANLPPPLCLEFVEALLDTPVSIQKHGIRLAFECFNAESLNKLVLRIWKKTQNVSLRMVIYISIFNKICLVTSGQDILFDTLKKLTLTLKPDDDDEVFRAIKSCELPDHLLPECIEITWKVVSQFPPKSSNLARMNAIIMFMCQKIDIIRDEFVCDIIESFIATVFVQNEENASKLGSEAADLIDAKWKLSATYIINVKGNDDFVKKTELTKLILKTCLKDTGMRNKKLALMDCFKFIHLLETRSYYQDFHHYENANKIMQVILETLEETLPIEKIYKIVWLIRLGTAARKVIAESKIKYADQKQINEQVMKEIANNFANELGILIKEFVDKKMFFATFITNISTIVLRKMQTVSSAIDAKAQFIDMKINICLGLIPFEITPIYLLVLNLLPDTCPEYKDEIQAIYKKLSTIDDIEFQCNLFNKRFDFDVKDQCPRMWHKDDLCQRMWHEANECRRMWHDDD